MRRKVIPELLDTDAGTPQEVAESLADLRAINRRFGGISTTHKLLERVLEATPGAQLSLLDVAAGSGDVSTGAAAELDGRIAPIVLFDRAATHLGNGERRVVGDALALPFRDASFDVVTCSLFFHHLEPPEIQQFTREAMRVARTAFLINDLRRSWTHLAAVRSAMPFVRSPITRHDGPVSIRRAYTMPEVGANLRAAGPWRIEMHRSYLLRMGVIVWK